MKKYKFKVGQKVKVIHDDLYAPHAVIGDVGIVKKVCEETKLHYAVEFQKNRIAYHDCSLTGEGPATKDKHGYWCTEEMLEAVTNETIVIYRNGNQVIALNKRTGEKAVAKCCPEDLFNFEYGASLAFSRLLGLDAEEQKDDSIKIGDFVKITNKMLLYSTYDFWSGLGIWKNNFIRKGYPDVTKKYKVLTIAKHDQDNSTLALIQDKLSKQVFIFGIEGLEKV